jgi:hypothetical protein
MLKSSNGVTSAASTINSTSALPVKSLNINAQLPKTNPWGPSTMWNGGVTPNVATAIDSTGSTITNTVGGGFSYHLSNEAIKDLTEHIGETAIENTGSQLAKEGAKRAGTSTLGTAMGAVGTALGAYTMANQIADFGSHRSASDMLANVGR